MPTECPPSLCQCSVLLVLYLQGSYRSLKTKFHTIFGFLVIFHTFHQTLLDFQFSKFCTSPVFNPLSPKHNKWRVNKFSQLSSILSIKAVRENLAFEVPQLITLDQFLFLITVWISCMKIKHLEKNLAVFGIHAVHASIAISPSRDVYSEAVYEKKTTVSIFENHLLLCL